MADAEETRTEMVEHDPAEVECSEHHVADLDEATKRFLSTYSTIRGKIDDLARAESDIKRFELSIEQERKRLQKTLDSARLALKNARVQIAVELSKLDAAGFGQIADLVKNREVTGA